jgi:hypothetical protein
MRGPKPKPDIICPRCNRIARPVRGYCKSCASVLVRQGKISKVLKHDTPESLTSEQDKVLTGLMLGDGCLYRDKPAHTPYLVVGRAASEELYLRENYEAFRVFCKRGPQPTETFDKRTKKTYYGVKFTTRRCKVFVPYYERWYPKGKKIVPKDIVLDPLALAIWFADDGSVRPSNSPWRMQLKLSTNGFTLSDVEMLKGMLEDIFGEYFYLTKGYGSASIGSSDAGARAFFKMIDDVFPASMTRKAYWKKDEARFFKNEPKRMNPDIGKHGRYEFRKAN